MIVGRVIGWILLIAGIAVLARDVFVWLDTGTLTLITAGELWFRIDNSSLNLVQAVIQRYVMPELWDPVLVTILLWPAFLVIGVPGALLSWACRPRIRRKQGMFT